MRFYRLDARHEIRRMSARRLWVLIAGLPSDSATWSGERNWTRQDEMLATAIEVADGWGRVLALAAGVKSSKVPTDVRKYATLRMERPEGVEDDEPTEHRPGGKEITTDTQKIARWFALHS